MKTLETMQGFEKWKTMNRIMELKKEMRNICEQGLLATPTQRQHCKNILREFNNLTTNTNTSKIVGKCFTCTNHACVWCHEARAEALRAKAKNRNPIPAIIRSCFLAGVKHAILKHTSPIG